MEIPTQMVVKSALGVLLAIGLGVALALVSGRVSPVPRGQSVPPVPNSTPETLSTTIAPPTRVGPEGANITEVGTYVLEVATRKLRRISESEFLSIHWLPAVNALLKITCCGETDGIDVIDLETNTIKRIYSGTVGAPSLSPDGKQIAFVQRITIEGGRTDTVGPFIMALDGGNLRQISDILGIQAIQWSPRGDYLALNIRYTIYFRLLRLSDGKETDITEVARPWSAVWAPDGGAIALGSPRGLLIYDVDAGSRREFSSNPSYEMLLWSPNAKHILRGQRIGGFPRSFLTSVINTAADEEHSLAAVYTAPSWSSDGHSIAYISDRCTERRWDLYTVSVNNNQRDQIATLQDFESPLEVLEDVLWSPRGSALAVSTIDRLIFCGLRLAHCRNRRFYKVASGRSSSSDLLVTRWWLSSLRR